MVERQARDLEVQVRIPAKVQIFLLKFMKYVCSSRKLMEVDGIVFWMITDGTKIFEYFY